MLQVLNLFSITPAENLVSISSSSFALLLSGQAGSTAAAQNALVTSAAFLYELVYTPYGVFNCSRGLQVRPTTTVPSVTCVPLKASPARGGHICKHHAMLIHMQLSSLGMGW